MDDVTNTDIKYFHTTSKSIKKAFYYGYFNLDSNKLGSLASKYIVDAIIISPKQIGPEGWDNVFYDEKYSLWIKQK